MQRWWRGIARASRRRAAARRRGFSEQQASRRGSGSWDGRSRFGRSGVQAARPRELVQSDRQVTGHRDRGRIVRGRFRRSWPFSNNIARSSWRIREGALALLTRSEQSEGTPLVHGAATGRERSRASGSDEVSFVQNTGAPRGTTAPSETTPTPARELRFRDTRRGRASGEAPAPASPPARGRPRMGRAAGRHRRPRPRGRSPRASARGW